MPLNPLEFIKYTPKSNCGECGHPTCLAFAVAVTKGGQPASACPHLDPAASVEAASGGGAGLEQVERMADARDMALVEHLRSKIADMDLAAAAPALGVEPTPGPPPGLRFSYLGQEILLGKEQGLSLAGGEAVDPRDQILLYNYVHSRGGGPPEGEWVGLESLPNSISKVRTLATYCEERIARRFTGRPGDLARLCERLGGQPGEGPGADVAMVIPVLPRLPMFLLFWDEDAQDGFDARAKVLFDARVMDYLDLESLVFAAERLADRLADLDGADGKGDSHA